MSASAGLFGGVTGEKQNALAARMAGLGILEGDLEEKFVRGSGKGGQKLNKTSSCVYLLHRPTGIEVKCQAGRQQSLNRFLARRELCDRLDDIRNGVKSLRMREIHRIRHQKKRRSRRQKEKLLEQKRRRSEKKARRAPAGLDD